MARKNEVLRFLRRGKGSIHKKWSVPNDCYPFEVGNTMTTTCKGTEGRSHISEFHDLTKILMAPFGHRMGTDLSKMVYNAILIAFQGR